MAAGAFGRHMDSRYDSTVRLISVPVTGRGIIVTGFPPPVANRHSGWRRRSHMSWSFFPDG